MKLLFLMVPWLCAVKFFFVCINFYAMAVADFYSDHCSFIVPKSVPNSEPPTNYQFGPFGEYQLPGFYYSNGVRIVDGNITSLTNSFLFYTNMVHKTDKDGLFEIEGSFELQSPFYVRSFSNGSSTGDRPVVADHKNPFNLKLHGFWSESSGNLCMVGTGSAYLKEGNLLTPAAVLKLHNIKNSSSITTLITGTLESLSPSNDDNNYFEPISILMLPPQLNYKWTFVSGDSVQNFSGGSDIEKNLPIYSVLQGGAFCSKFSSPRNVFHLDYTSCSTGKNCHPSGGVIEKLPSSVYLDIINCIDDAQRRVHVLLKFQDNSNFRFFRPFNPNTTLVGEGMWDDQKNQLCVFLCRFLGITDNSWSNAYVGDCTARLSLRFPAIWSIKETSNIMGQIWTNKTVNDSGYFDEIMLRGSRSSVESLHGLKYKYTEIKRVRKLCLGKKVLNKRQGYPSPYSSDMKFDMSVKNSQGKTGWGSADALTVGNQFYQPNRATLAIDFPKHTVVKPTRWEPQGHANISYKIEIRLFPTRKLTDEIYVPTIHAEEMEITAEGIYDADTGGLCMVGCRKFASTDQVKKNVSLDCEILLNFQLAPIEHFKNEGYIKGRIESTRKTSDPLYFDHLDVSSVSYNREEAWHSIWTMDVEIVMVLISKTLACLFVRCQLHHVKRHPETLPFISLVMLVILTLGQMIPLVLNYEALFLHKHDQNTVLSQAGGWVEVNEVIVRIISMAAFLLQFRILQLAFSCRSNNQRNQKGLWIAERMSSLVTISMYIAGAFILMLVDKGNSRREVVFLPIRPVDYWQSSTLDDLKSYSGLVSDGFLLPQILLNMFSNSRENVLSPKFYIGTSFARLLPHVYDLYSDDHSFVQYKGTRIYANPNEDFFSTAWDVIIPLGVLLFATIIYLQQKFGGRCILPQRFRGLEGHEIFPLASES